MPTYMELFNAATGDTTTLSRTTVAVAKYSAYVLGSQANYSAAKIAWAKAALADTQGQAAQLMWGIVGDAAYQSAGEAIDDTSLQTALETTVNAIYP